MKKKIKKQQQHPHQRLLKKHHLNQNRKKIYMTFATFNVLTTKFFVNSIVVLNCIADIHVCNQIMKHKYTKKRKLKRSNFCKKS